MRNFHIIRFDLRGSVLVLVNGEHSSRELVDRPAVLQIVLDAVDVEA